MKIIFLLAAVNVFFSHEAYSQTQDFTLAPLFTDNLVLQQKSDVPVWGKGIPGEVIFISTSWGKKAKGTVQPDSTWMVKIKTPKAGGPYSITLVCGKETIKLNNVLIGEVWLCSGQSNMEMPLEGWPPRDTILNSTYEISNANFPKIRMFTVKRAISPEPLTQCEGTWSECTPEAAAKFSATAFFFGKKLFQQLKVPIGLIQSTWGGTPVEAWTSEKFIVQHPDYKNFPEKIAQGKMEIEQFVPWLASHKTIDVTTQTEKANWTLLDFNDSVCAQKDFNDSAWSTMTLPTLWERTSVGNFNGVVWFRKRIEIPNEWRGNELVLELGPIDDFDATFVNGNKVGGYETGSPWNLKRVYTVPAEFAKDSLLIIAVRVIDTYAGGGIYGPVDQLQIHPAAGQGMISLAGEWKYLPVAELRERKIYMFDIPIREFMQRPQVTMEFSPMLPTTLYNAMIAPLVPYAIKGAIWYQGEGNTDNPEAYRSLFPLMINNWRADWNNNFSFYFTQIAPFNYDGGRESQRLREAQLQTLSVPKTGMAVTLDIGNPINIHPTNKTDVGERLARWALAKDYGKKIPYSGPIYTSMKVKKESIILTFDYAEGLHVNTVDGKNYFQIAGEDSVFHDATVTIQGKTLLIQSSEVKKPIAVRYAWDNVAEATLFNKAGLPASSFRTDNWNK